MLCQHNEAHEGPENSKRHGWGSVIEPELTLILQLLLYKYSVWNSGSTYGAKLQGLRYASSKSRTHGTSVTPSGLPTKTLLLHGALTVALPYADKRLRAHALSNSWPDAPSFDRRRKIWNLLTRVESTHATLSLLSFVLFLWNGRYRAIADRIIGLRLVPSRTLLNRNVSYEFMNRQMVWHAFTEFLLFLLPILNTRAIRRRIARGLSSFKWTDFIPPQIRPQVSSESRESRVKRGRYYDLPENECAICAEDASMDLSLLKDTKMTMQTPGFLDRTSGPRNEQPVIPAYPVNTPYKASCGHVYCYVCIADRLLRAADEGEKYWECLRCEEKITHVNRQDEIDTRHGRRTARSMGSGDSVHVQRRWSSVVSSSVSRIGGGYGTSDLDESELLALDSVSSIGPRTHSGSDDLSE
ncbi:hypothetical protein M408DRAFT_16827 [Serendipita vermifera MAFF 305830]|uniref:RING-type E3 ubiquitin transferase (cysteine targeting) n=1 Tax=Serendipita vermifera MAFF 305830 TaxID=933852 RepID=A0A0C3AQC5_SERVB|nr:hypothetical protein M408DRAFT_16827 [Serendipita vermifera MAFF 305830]